MTFFLTLFFFFLIVGVLVFIHELGHFLAAKLSGVEVKEFAIGFGKTIFSREYKGTKYSINLLPLGGFVQLEGENEDLGPNSFRNQKLRVKAFVLLAGVVMNLLLAVVLLGIYLNSNGYKFIVPKLTEFTFSNTDSQQTFYPLSVTYVDPEGPSKGQLSEGDVIIGIDNVDFENSQQFLDTIKANQNKTLTFDFLDMKTFETSTRQIKVGVADEKGSILRIGFSAFDTETKKPAYFIKYKQTFLSGFSMTYDFFIYQFKALGSLIKNAVSTGNYQEVSDNVRGLPAIGSEISQAVEFQAFDILIPLTALFSVNLAMFNVLPFPALDGGQLFFAVIEKVTRRKIPDNILEKINLAGFLFLVGLGLVVALKDIAQLNWLQGIGTFINNVLGK